MNVRCKLRISLKIRMCLDHGFSEFTPFGLLDRNRSGTPAPPLFPHFREHAPHDILILSLFADSVIVQGNIMRLKVKRHEKPPSLATVILTIRRRKVLLAS